MTNTDTRIGRDGRRQTLFSALYGRYLRRAVADILKVAWKAVKNVHAAKFDIDGMGDEEGKAVGWNSERIMALVK